MKLSCKEDKHYNNKKYIVYIKVEKEKLCFIEKLTLFLFFGYQLLFKKFNLCFV